MNINLDKRLLNNLFFDLKDCNSRYIVSYGGKGSSKTFSALQMLIYTCCTNEDFRILVLRKVKDKLQETIVADALKIIKAFKIRGTVYNKVDKTITFPNNSKIIFMGLENYEDIKGVSDIKIIFMDEANHFIREDFIELDTRLRGLSPNFKRKFIISFNPVSELSWLKETFFDTEDEEFLEEITIFKTTYLDNRFLDDDYKRALLRLRNLDYNEYRVSVLAEWGSERKGNEIYKNFDPIKHVSKDVEYNKDLPIILSFDKNNDPYLTCMLIQVDGNNFNIFDEICIPNYNLDKVLQEFVKRHPEHKNGVIICGDTTSLQREVLLAEGQNMYTIILDYLKPYNAIKKLTNINPSVMMRTMWVNRLLANEEIKIRIALHCREVIRDFEGVKDKGDGTKLKNYITVKGRKYQEFGHTTDATEYALTQIFTNEFNKFVSGGGNTYVPVQGMRSFKIKGVY